jgi:hypothetical protein
MKIIYDIFPDNLKNIQSIEIDEILFINLTFDYSLASCELQHKPPTPQ